MAFDVIDKGNVRLHAAADLWRWLEIMRFIIDSPEESVTIHGILPPVTIRKEDVCDLLRGACGFGPVRGQQDVCRFAVIDQERKRQIHTCEEAQGILSDCRRRQAYLPSVWIDRKTVDHEQ